MARLGVIAGGSSRRSSTVDAASERTLLARENRYNTEVRPGYLLLLLALGPACNFDLGFDGTNYQCGEGGRCPDGQSCVAGVCTLAPDALDAPGDDGGSSVDASTDASPLPLVCGNLGLLSDTFDVDGPGAFFSAFNDSGATVAEGGGQLVVDINANSGAFAGYRSAFFYDLHSGGLELAVAEVTRDLTILEVRNHLGNSAQLAVQGTDVYAALFNVSGAGTLAQRAWDPTEKYWRIREEGGDMVWELSRDRLTWSTLHRRALPFDVAHVVGLVSGGGDATLPSRARFDDVNLTPSAARFCSADELHDDFATAPLGPTWEPYTSTGCTIVEAGGNLVMAYTAVNNNSFCGLTALHLWNLSSGTGLVIEGAPFPNRNNFVSYFQALKPGDDRTRVEITLDGNLLEARSYVNEVAVAVATVTNDRVAHRWWRLRGLANAAIMETSPDKITWNELLRTNVSFPLTNVVVNLGAGNYGASTAVTIMVPGINAD